MARKKQSVTIEERRAIELRSVIEELANTQGVSVRHQLSHRVADLPPGTWVFGTLLLGACAGEVYFKYEGHSTPPNVLPPS